MPQLKQLNMENIDMWRHPKYYKELRKRNKSDQVISSESGTPPNERAPGPGLKQQAIEETVPHNDIEEAQASSVKPQAPEASSGKHQAPSNKRQA